ncbi:MAG: SpoIIE family protein phosphatase, partial [Bacteroidales bacterium]|nr:SpoIIE family protein phosphatase [Bacteroidales bacterium]
VKTHLFTKAQTDLVKKQNEELLNINIKIKTLAQQLKIKNKDLISSIQYAKFIQRATLPTETYISQFLPENFIFYRPKDIVSGDFYWIKQIQNQILVAVADCTGHGVPGALLSMLGITYLNEIVANYPKSTQIKASEILDKLRDNIKDTLNNDEGKLTRDGLDIALCIIDVNTKILQYSGAHSPIYIIRQTDENTKKLYKFKADKMPVGAHLKEKPFSNHPIQLQTNDIIYMFSDGYSDQFGGAYGNKYFTSNFRKLLLDIADKPLKKQKEILFLEHEDWRGYYKQIDDILVLGFKISQTYGDDIEFF